MTRTASLRGVFCGLPCSGDGTDDIVVEGDLGGFALVGAGMRARS